MTDKGFLGEIRMYSFDAVPEGWAPCNGQLMNIEPYMALFSLLGTTFGGDGNKTFALPDLRGKIVIGIDDRYGVALGETAPALSDDTERKKYGMSLAREPQPCLAVLFCIAIDGIYPVQP
jgi:microcystin-dependent protein